MQRTSTDDDGPGTGTGPENVDPFEPLPPQVGLGPSGQAAIAAGAAYISLVHPPSAVVVAGVATFLPALGEKLSRVQNEKTQELLAGAITQSALTPEDVVRELVERHDLALLTAEALDAARRTRLPGKPSVLGRSLGAILADDAQVDPESIWIRVIATVEPPHIRVLGMLLERTGKWSDGTPLWGSGSTATIRDIAERLGLHEAVVPLVQDLLRTGLVTNKDIQSPGTSDPMEEPFKATNLAAQLFRRLSVDNAEF